MRVPRHEVIDYLLAHAELDRGDDLPRVKVLVAIRAHRAYTSVSAGSPWRGRGGGRRWRERRKRLLYEAASLVASNRVLYRRI